MNCNKCKDVSGAFDARKNALKLIENPGTLSQDEFNSASDCLECAASMIAADKTREIGDGI